MFFCPSISSSQHRLQKNDEDSVDLTEEVAISKEKLPALLSEYQERDIFNFDKVASFFLMVQKTRPWQ